LLKLMGLLITMKKKLLIEEVLAIKINQVIISFTEVKIQFLFVIKVEFQSPICQTAFHKSASEIENQPNLYTIFHRFPNASYDQISMVNTQRCRPMNLPSQQGKTFEDWATIP
jgi:CO dehydrogenase/acetyl-CoA synthase delta subunit